MKETFLLSNKKIRLNFIQGARISIITILTLYFTFTAVTAQTITTSTTPVKYPLKASAIVVDNNIIITSASTITDIRVTISSNFNSGDVLSYTTSALPNGVIALYQPTIGVLSFTGSATAAEWQALLRTVAFSSSSDSYADRAVVFSFGSNVSATNGHFYEFVPFGPLPEDILSWHQSKAEAAARTYFGMQGYLATITSQEENDIIHKRLLASGWIGSTDDYREINGATGKETYLNQAAAEGKWYWVTGPEAGKQFSESAYNGAEPKPIEGMFTNWSPVEPNNNWNQTRYNEYGEQYGEIYSGTTSWGHPGKWNDFYSINTDGDFVRGYVVEYGGLPSDPPLMDISASRTIIIASALPVTGLKFTGAGTGSAVLLKWSTLSETNNSHFEIWRSPDGEDFHKIGVHVAPGGNSTSNRNYQFMDYTPFEGINYYRLKQYDSDGHFTFSSILKVDWKGTRSNSWTVYPNPVHNGGNINLTIHSLEPQKAHLVLTNSVGQRVWSSGLSLSIGMAVYPFTLGNLPAGCYYLALYDTRGAMIADVKKIQFR